VTDVFLPKPNRGFAFVTYEKGEAAKAALNVSLSIVPPQIQDYWGRHTVDELLVNVHCCFAVKRAYLEAIYLSN
jgi:hypothetical protein